MRFHQRIVNKSQRSVKNKRSNALQSLLTKRKKERKPHQSTTQFPSGAPPHKKNPGCAPVESETRKTIFVKRVDRRIPTKKEEKKL